jgi:hypothetical protein
MNRGDFTQDTIFCIYQSSSKAYLLEWPLRCYACRPCWKWMLISMMGYSEMGYSDSDIIGTFTAPSVAHRKLRASRADAAALGSQDSVIDKILDHIIRAI